MIEISLSGCKNHVLISFASDKFGQNVPAGLRLGPVTLYLAGDPDHTKVFFQPTPGLASRPAAAFAIKYVFGTLAHVVPPYEDDESGQLTKRTPGSKTSPKHCIEYFHRKVAHRHLTGANGIKIDEQYMAILSRNLVTNTSKEGDWVDSADL